MHAGISPDHPSHPAEATHGASMAEHVSSGMPGLCRVPPPQYSLLQELLQATDLEDKVLDVNSVQLVVCVAQCLVDEQVHGGGACEEKGQHCEPQGWWDPPPPPRAFTWGLLGFPPPNCCKRLRGVGHLQSQVKVRGSRRLSHTTVTFRLTPWPSCSGLRLTALHTKPVRE